MLAILLSALTKLLGDVLELIAMQIDGVIDIERTKSWQFEHPDAKISADAVCLSLDSCGISG